MTASSTGAPPEGRFDAIRVECIRTLYRQIPNSFVAAMGVTLYMVVTAWNKVPGADLAWWLGLQLVAQCHRFIVLFGYRRAEQAQSVTARTAEFWAHQYTYYMAGAGIVWGSAVFFFFRPDSPLSQALTMCGLYGISGGAVPGNAYHPPAINTFLLLIFGAVMARMLMLGGVDYIALGIASLFFAAIMILFCRVQNRTILESLRIRFENVALLERLRLETARAEAARLRAEQASLAKSRFLAAASHDLRQPLHSLGLLSASLQTLRLSDDDRKIVERIYASIDSLEELFDDLLDISKLDAGVIEPRIIDFPAHDLLRRCASRFESLAEEKGLRLVVRPSTAILRSDPALCGRILDNLVANAIRYTARGGALVACRKRAGTFQIEVWDSGIGIETSEQERIFEEFFQIGNTERDRRKGLGLGLAIARRTADLLQSTVQVSSRTGHGSVFRFTVPAGDRSRLGTTIERTDERQGDALFGCSVVIIDDEITIRDGMQDLLTRWGCRAVAATNAAESIDGLGKLVPDLIIADYRLHGGQIGTDEIAILRRHYGNAVPGLIVTGDTAPERLLELKQGGYEVLHKPVRPAQLRAMCNFLLTRGLEPNQLGRLAGDASAFPSEKI